MSNSRSLYKLIVEIPSIWNSQNFWIKFGVFKDVLQKDKLCVQIAASGVAGSEISSFRFSSQGVRPWSTFVTQVQKISQFYKKSMHRALGAHIGCLKRPGGHQCWLKFQWMKPSPSRWMMQVRFWALSLFSQMTLLCITFTFRLMLKGMELGQCCWNLWMHGCLNLGDSNAYERMTGPWSSMHVTAGWKWTRVNPNTVPMHCFHLGKVVIKCPLKRQFAE